MPNTNEFLIYNGRVAISTGLTDPGYVAVEDGKVRTVGRVSDIEIARWPDRFDAKGAFVFPGFIDLHLHGGFGVSFFEIEEGVVERICARLPELGVTGFLAATAYWKNDLGPIRELRNTVQQIRRDPQGAVPLGISLEGPFINAEHRGGFSPEHVHEAKPELFEALLDATGEPLRLMTLAPEAVMETGYIRELRERNIVAACGHTGATVEIMHQAIEEGLGYATHLYNAMAPFHHREPGPVGAVLNEPKVIAELICDGHHVHPEALRLAVAQKGVDGVCAATDGTPFLGCADGDYERWGYRLTARDGAVRRSDGCLVGTTLPMPHHLKTLVEASGLPIEEVVRCFTSTPAKVLGLGSSKGRLAPGYDADITAIDSDYNVLATWCGGKQVFAR